MSEYKQLVKAVKDGDIDAVNAALEAGADPNPDAQSDGKKSKTPVLVAAVLSGDAEICDALIKAGASVEVTGKRGKSLLRIAYEVDSPELFSILLKAGCSIADSDDTPLLVYLIQDAASDEFVEPILKQAESFDINATDKDGYTALHLALERGDNALALKLLKPPFKAKTNIATKKAQLYACHVAAASDSDSILSYMKKDELAHKNAKGSSALSVAVSLMAKSAVDVLIEKGLDVNEGNNDGWRPIHHACERGDLDVIQKLIDSGAEINSTTDKGHSALDLVLGFAEVQDFDSEAMISLLKSKGAEESKVLDLDEFLADDDAKSDCDEDNGVEDASMNAEKARKKIAKMGKPEEPQGVSWQAYTIVGMLLFSMVMPMVIPLMSLFEEPPNLFKELDTNEDGKISKKEVKVWYKQAHPEEKKLPAGFFESRDLDQSGYIDWDEFEGPKGRSPP